MAALLALGLLLAAGSGTVLARRMVVPIRRLQSGAERLGSGERSEPIEIRTGDEIETLADRFNQMAAKVQESHDTLEAKVDARTEELQAREQKRAMPGSPPNRRSPICTRRRTAWSKPKSSPRSAS